MFNPFAAFEPRYLPEFRKKGVIAFVKQAYARGKNLLEENPRASFMLSHYNEMQLANQHIESLTHDPSAQLILLDKDDGYSALEKLLENKNALYYTRLLLKDANHKAKKMLDKKIHTYIDRKSGWNPRGYDEVGFNLDIIFGQIYVDFKYRGKEIKIKLEELENQKDYVL